ncbi:GerMN domain-containing protein [Paenibacillus sp. ACRRX]|uniref:GerMN domain-containing protein n=1 Tax=unclassified Paenibacillus TaxID=185978 RepID=UPI001EF3DEF8|nr:MULTISPECIES: GerMN domain-containing protein [unclassified Paenibacillus]MCG7406679.1 GerMN domain-containing protein [Paenibacillus sp. ACRRX]MDK8179697.1 GerMN domain-containing protein [Paenibacillus sp. UMB4589-SE434]
MKKRNWLGLVTLVLAVGLVSACGDKNLSNGDGKGVTEPPTAGTEQPTTGTGTTTPGTEQPTPDKEPVKKPEQKEQQITVYATDDQIMELLSYTTKITFKDDHEKIGAALKTLQKSEDAKYVPLWDGNEFKSYKLDEKGILTVDVHISEHGHLGAGGEAFAIDALTKTLFQFEEIKAIDILVDGKPEASLMGHVTLDHPIKRP